MPRHCGGWRMLTARRAGPRRVVGASGPMRSGPCEGLGCARCGRGDGCHACVCVNGPYEDEAQCRKPRGIWDNCVTALF
eukprot:561716-Prymnesium_polylepis.1